MRNISELEHLANLIASSFVGIFTGLGVFTLLTFVDSGFTFTVIMSVLYVALISSSLNMILYQRDLAMQKKEKNKTVKFSLF